MADIRVPTLGESVTEATVGKWFKQPGEAVAVDEPVVELETDKVTLEVPAPSLICPSSAATPTVSPVLAAMSDKTPVAGAGTSSVTLSVSSSTTGSSTATASPGCLNHLPTVASVTDS